MDYQLEIKQIVDYPCLKDAGFFFFPIASVHELISMGKCSEMDIVLDLWIHAIYNDEQVQGSEVGPVVYFRNCTGNPLTSYSDLSLRWGISKVSVSRILNKLQTAEYLSLVSFPGRHGSVIYLCNYLSTMFNISDVMIDDEFLDSIYLAGADVGGSKLENYAKSIERSNKMIQLLNSAVDILRSKHKHGEQYYWILYYSYLSPQQLQNTEEVLEKLAPHIMNISRRTYYRKRPEAIQALSSILWGYTSKDCLQMLNQFFPENSEK